MRILLDESVPQKLRLLIEEPGVSVVTTWFQGWSGLRNGELLTAAEDDGFDLFITADQELTYQQNLAGRKIAILILSTNNWALIQASIRDIVAAIRAVTPGDFRVVRVDAET